MKERLIARYARQLDADMLEVVSVFEGSTQRSVCDTADPHIGTIAMSHPAAVWFERKMADDFGIVIDGAYDTRPLVHHERFPEGIHPMRREFTQTHLDMAPFRPYLYEEVGGEGAFCVAVGPIHAGIIEPGHFHFSQAGEEMLHQEVRHFYKYRAIEKMLEGHTLPSARAMIERISGNASVAYQIAWRDLFLQASGASYAPAQEAYDAILLEIERVVHHLTDIGFIPNDAGFGAALAYASRLAEDTRRLMHTLSAHRFGFGAVAQGVEQRRSETIRQWCETLQEQIERFEAWIVDIPSLWDRFDTTGVLKRDKALRYDAVGVVARASGIAYDVRATQALYLEAGFETITQQSGDVAARFKQRIAEIKQSLALIGYFMQKLEETAGLDTACACQSGYYESMVESATGALFMCVYLDGDGKIERFFARDAAFMNWQVLHAMMPGNIIPDFPLINKSCDLSYAGNDL